MHCVPSFQVAGVSGGKYSLPYAASDWAPNIVLPALGDLVVTQNLQNLEQEHFEVLRSVITSNVVAPVVKQG